MTIDDELVALRFCGALESPIYGVVLQHVGHILWIDKRVIVPTIFASGLFTAARESKRPIRRHEFLLVFDKPHLTIAGKMSMG